MVKEQLTETMDKCLDTSDLILVPQSVHSVFNLSGHSGGRKLNDSTPEDTEIEPFSDFRKGPNANF
jgi:hypothetical protein